MERGRSHCRAGLEFKEGLAQRIRSSFLQQAALVYDAGVPFHHVRAGHLEGFLWIALTDSTHDLRVLGIGDNQTIGSRKAPKALHVQFAGKTLIRTCKAPIATHLAKRPVKRHIQRIIRAYIGSGDRLIHRNQVSLQFVQLCPCGVFGKAPCHGTQRKTSGDGDFTEFFVIHVPHEETPIGHVFQKPNTGERPARLTNRSTADPDLIGEAQLVDALIWRETSINNHRLDLMPDEFTERVPLEKFDTRRADVFLTCLVL